ncbi:MAG TPA: hypothetical protein VGC16_09860 [Rhizomicrobium sp.]
MQDETLNTETGPAKAVTQFSDSLTHAGESHRALVQEMTSFAKDEAKRFFNLRLERNNVALDKLSHSQGLTGIIGVQQEWLRDLMADYTSQQMRLATTLQGISHNVMACASDAASHNIERLQQQAADMTHQAEEAVHHAEDAGHQAVHTGEQMVNTAQDMNNNYVQH